MLCVLCSDVLSKNRLNGFLALTIYIVTCDLCYSDENCNNIDAVVLYKLIQQNFCL